MHISINEEISFKGLVYKKTNLSEVDFVFNGRYFDFSYKDAKNVPRFHVHLRMKHKAKFNIIFKAELSDGNKKRRNIRRVKQLASFLVNDKVFKQQNKITERGWHNEFIHSLQAMDVFEGNERARRKVDVPIDNR